MKKLTTQNIKKYGALMAVFFLMVLTAEDVSAQVIHNQNARMDVRGTARRTSRRVDRRQDVVDGDVGYVAPVATAAAVTATAAVLYALPGGCIDRSGLFDCNGIRYRPQYQGTTLVYVQVND